MVLRITFYCTSHLSAVRRNCHHIIVYTSATRKTNYATNNSKLVMNHLLNTKESSRDTHNNSEEHHKPRLRLLSLHSLHILSSPRIDRTGSAYTRYIKPGMANMINDPNSDPFNPMTFSTFVCRMAIVTVVSSTPTAVLPLTRPPRPYASRSHTLWNSFAEQKSWCRLVRTAK